MIISAWRFTKSKHAHAAFSGEGSRQNGGRWNNKGIPLVYASSHVSLAVLELLVNIEDTSILTAYVLFGFELDEDIVEVFDDSKLPHSWRASPPPSAVRKIGDTWYQESHSVALSVPSAVIPSERNYLLNPSHPDFSKSVLRTTEPMTYDFDPRLVELSRSS